MFRSWYIFLHNFSIQRVSIRWIVLLLEGSPKGKEYNEEIRKIITPSHIIFIYFLFDSVTLHYCSQSHNPYTSWGISCSILTCILALVICKHEHTSLYWLFYLMIFIWEGLVFPKFWTIFLNSDLRVPSANMLVTVLTVTCISTFLWSSTVKLKKNVCFANSVKFWVFNPLCPAPVCTHFIGHAMACSFATRMS